MSTAPEVALVPRRSPFPTRHRSGRSPKLAALRFAFVVVALLAAGLSSIRWPDPAPVDVHEQSTRPGDDDVATRPFSPNSFWNTPLPDDVAADPEDQQLVSNFNEQWKTYYGGVGI